MDYKIISFNKDAGQISVEYDGKWTFSIDLPINNGLYPVGEELDQLIQQFAPTWLLDRYKALEAGVANAADIEALVIPTTTAPVDDQSAAIQEILFQQKIADALVKLGVLDQPTA